MNENIQKRPGLAHLKKDLMLIMMPTFELVKSIDFIMLLLIFSWINFFESKRSLLSIVTRTEYYNSILLQVLHISKC